MKSIILALAMVTGCADVEVTTSEEQDLACSGGPGWSQCCWWYADGSGECCRSGSTTGGDDSYCWTL